MRTVGITFIRPYAEPIRLEVESTLRRAGGVTRRVFRAPIEPSAVDAYLADDGRDDALVIPFLKSCSESGVELAARFVRAGGALHAIVMPTRYALPSVVEPLVLAALGAALARCVLVVSVGEMPLRVNDLRAHIMQM